MDKSAHRVLRGWPRWRASLAALWVGATWLAAAVAAEAPGAPGAGSAWTTGAKQGLGTSTTLASKVWYTIGQGITHEVYYPQVDTPNVQDLQFIVTDGRSFVDLERDATDHEVQRVDSWEKTAVFVTWDDWGGWFDHVVPPVKETWDSARAQRPEDAHPEFDGDPFRFGSRVPCLVIRPYAKAGPISHQENSHVSIVKFCETIFGLPPFNQRDAGSNGMSDCFAFTQQPLPAPHSGGS